jgi:hypothetical protein
MAIVIQKTCSWRIHEHDFHEGEVRMPEYLCSSVYNG